MRRLFVAAICAAAVGLAFADTGDVIQLSKDRPGEDGVVHFQGSTVVVMDDGKVDRTFFSTIVPFSPWPNAHGYFDPTITWNDSRSELKIFDALSNTPDGRVVKAKDNSIVPNTAFALEGAAPYSYVRQMTIAQVGVEKDAATSLMYAITDRAPSGVPAWGVFDLGGELPVQHLKVDIAVLAAQPLEWTTIGCGDRRITPEIRVAEHRRMIFDLRDIPAAKLGEASPRRAGICRLVWSTAKDWDEVRTFLAARILPAAAPTDVITAKAAELVKPAWGDLERLAKLHAFVVEGIATVGFPLEYFDWKARPAADVLASSVGHTLDKAVLLTALLRAQGFDAAPAFVAGERGVPLTVATPVLLDEVRVRVNWHGRTLWLDPAAGQDASAGPQLAGRLALVLDGAKGAPTMLPELDTASNRAALCLKLQVSEAGGQLKLTGREDLDLAGLYQAARSFDRDTDRLAALASAPLGGRIAPKSAELAASKASEIVVAERTPDAVALRAKVDGGVIVLPRDGRPLALSLPRVPGAVSADALQLQRTARVLPLNVSGPAEETVEVALDLPDAVRVLAAPAPVTLENAAGRFVRTVTRDGKTLTVRTVLALNGPIVASADYAGLRALFAAQNADAARMIVLAAN